MERIKVSLVVNDAAAAIEALASLGESPWSVAVSISRPHEAEEVTPSRIKTPFGPTIAVELGADGKEEYAVYFWRGSTEVRAEISVHQHSMLQMFGQARVLYRGAKEFHNALCVHDPKRFAHRATATVRGDYSTLAKSSHTFGWPLVVDRGVYGFQVLLEEISGL